eukprot:6866820-Pyramimonas_sp.AAC.1
MQGQVRHVRRLLGSALLGARRHSASALAGRSQAPRKSSSWATHRHLSGALPGLTAGTSQGVPRGRAQAPRRCQPRRSTGRRLVLFPSARQRLGNPSWMPASVSAGARRRLPSVFPGLLAAPERFGLLA